MARGRRQDAEKALADWRLEQLASCTGVSREEALAQLDIFPQAAAGRSLIRGAFALTHAYRDALDRLKSFRAEHTPMPGVETGVRDGGGRRVGSVGVDGTSRESGRCSAGASASALRRLAGSRVATRTGSAGPTCVPADRCANPGPGPWLNGSGGRPRPV